MAKDNARMSLKWAELGDGFTWSVRGFTQEWVPVAAIPESVRGPLTPDGKLYPAARLGLGTKVINAGAGAKDWTDDQLHGKISRCIESLKQGAWEQNVSGGINWSVFPEALTLVRNAADGGNRLQADVQRKLLALTGEQQLALYQDKAVQAEVTRILHERALEAAARTPSTVRALMDSI